MVGRADMWRMRMDTATNWAIGATAAVLSFALGNTASPHYVVHIAALLTLSFLILESRRLTFYHLWQQRVLLLEMGLIRPALQPGTGLDLASSLEPHLGRTAPSMPLMKAVARRLRRVYVYMFGVQLLAWTLKLSNHPTPTSSPSEWIVRAGAGAIPGSIVVATTCALFAVAVLIATFHGGRATDRQEP